MNQALSFFNLQINNIKTKLNISSDLAYLLLKKFEWNEEDLISNWNKDQSGILASLNLNGKNASEIENLRLKNINDGLCPICNQTKPLLELYCKHSACIECWKKEILSQIKSNKIAKCISNKDGNKCESIISSLDIPFLFDEQIHQQYVKILLDDFIDSNNSIYRCNAKICNEVIVKDDSLPCNLGKCNKCNYHFCFKCGYKNGHCPITDCDKVNDFYLTLPAKMSIIEASQKRWLARELKLIEHRRQHLDEVRQTHENNLEAIKHIHQTLSDQELHEIEQLNQQIHQTEQKIQEIEYQTPQKTEHPTSTNENIITENSINENKNVTTENTNSTNVNANIVTENPNSINENVITENPDSTNDKIITENQELITGNDELNELKTSLSFLTCERNRMNRKHKINDLQRKSDENVMKIASDSLISSYTEPKKEKFAFKFNSIIKQKIGNIDQILKSDFYTKPTTKRCPNCHAKIVKTKYDTNRVHCDKCKFDFCWICEDKWHLGKAHCPKLCAKSALVNYGNMKDLKYYIPPILDADNLETLNWIQFNNRFIQHQKAITKLEIDFEPLLKNKLKEIVQIDQLFAFQLFNTLSFAMSTISWIFPSLYYNHGSVMEFDMIMTSMHVNQLYTAIYDPAGKSKDFFEYIMKQTEEDILSLISQLTK